MYRTVKYNIVYLGMDIFVYIFPQTVVILDEKKKGTYNIGIRYMRAILSNSYIYMYSSEFFVLGVFLVKVIYFWYSELIYIYIYTKYKIYTLYYYTGNPKVFPSVFTDNIIYLYSKVYNNLQINSI